MAEVLLIHGSGFGAWCWRDVIPLLAGHGHHARAIDLPGRGGEETTLMAQAQAIATDLRGPTVLVGHSAGGFPITAAAAISPLVTALIYLAAYVPAPGQSVASLRRAGPSQPMKGAFQITPDRKAYGFDPVRAADLFFHDCPNPQAAVTQLCLEPIAPQESICEKPARALPQAAIICDDDRAIPPDWQRCMAAGIALHSLPTGHCPFLSQPANLAASLHTILVQHDFATIPVAS
jgi:pimeloyl-ACP methyl ester carboxylesterase